MPGSSWNGSATRPPAHRTRKSSRGRISINDSDFGDLIFNHGLPAPKTILYTRLPHRAAQQTAARLIALLEAGVPAGQMITLTKNGARTKPFPPGAHHG
jgi:hypothetical protein